MFAGTTYYIKYDNPFFIINQSNLACTSKTSFKSSHSILVIIYEMASFVREILSTTGHLGEKEDLCAKASRLKGRVNELKASIHEFLLCLSIGFSNFSSHTLGSNIQFHFRQGYLVALNRDMKISPHLLLKSLQQYLN